MRMGLAPGWCQASVASKGYAARDALARMEETPQKLTDAAPLVSGVKVDWCAAACGVDDRSQP